MKCISYLALIFLIIACGNSNSDAEGQLANNSSTEKKGEQATASTNPGDGIVGTWKMSLDAFDKNDNEVLDEEERKNAVANNYVLQLNADGTCKLQQVFTGRYEVTTENGKQILRVYRKKVEGEEDKDPLPDVYIIKSVGQEEMVLLVVDGGESTTFWIFKRIK
jgi:hypothetical protein